MNICLTDQIAYFLQKLSVLTNFLHHFSIYPLKYHTEMSVIHEENVITEEFKRQ